MENYRGKGVVEMLLSSGRLFLFLMTLGNGIWPGMSRYSHHFHASGVVYAQCDSYVWCASDIRTYRQFPRLSLLFSGTFYRSRVESYNANM
uniref:Putative secreted protein n=1 Tax=Anopheles darlingi TaxID=43151 RepID=A0A2M4D3P4_ANODA